MEKRYEEQQVDHKISKAKPKIKDLITQAGGLLKSNLGKAEALNTTSVDMKIDTDLIVEKFLIEGITNLFPDHNIYSEEQGNVDKESDFTWLIDPIDGSYHYLRGLPIFAISLALKYKESFILSYVLNPILDELFWCSIQDGALLNNNPIKVSKTQNLQDIFLLIDFPNGTVNEDVFKFSFEILKKLVKRTYRVRVMGVSSLAMCYVAAGRADAYISLSPRTRIYDKAAGMFIIEMANGITTDISMQGNPLIVCSNKKIHNSLMEAIKV